MEMNNPTKRNIEMKLTWHRPRGSHYYHFYLDEKDVTNEWMWFFSGLSIEEEENCVELFMKWYKKHETN